MNTYLRITCCIKILLLFTLLINNPVDAQDPEESVIDVNNIIYWVRNDGYHPENKVVVPDILYDWGWNGSFPKGIPVGFIYTEGIVWGGKVFDGQEPLIRISGSTYFSGNVPITRLYRVRTYYKDENLRDDAANFFLVSPEEVTNAMLEIIYQQYEKDWNEWPAEKGAPFYDRNKNGIYEPTIDIPGIPGSSQTIWIDYDDNNSYDFYGSLPIGLEVQETYWAYTYSEVQNVIYKHVKIIYKGTENSSSGSFIDSMYITQFVDTDLGVFFDDYLGCDTLLNLGYTYNYSNVDTAYDQYLQNPPAAGYVFLQGVAQRTGNPIDSAIVNFKWTHGYKFFHPKPMTIFIAHRSGGSWGDPLSQDPEGTLKFYNLMRGYLPSPPYPNSITLVNPYGIEFGGFSTYNLSGDPLTQTGWVDGLTEPSGDRRMWMMTGPFNMNKGDTAEVVVALVGATGSDYLGNIGILRYNTQNAILDYINFVYQMTTGNIQLPPLPPFQQTLPKKFVLYQNYPNPFNLSTKIWYSIPQTSKVTFKIFDILGKEVATLVNEEKTVDIYEVEWDASNYPSGVYFYRLNTNGFVETKKMVFMK